MCALDASCPSRRKKNSLLGRSPAALELVLPGYTAFLPRAAPLCLAVPSGAHPCPWQPRWKWVLEGIALWGCIATGLLPTGADLG